jgi:holo-[acyl-carrier protein] synthase
MIKGVGIDVVEIPRFRKILKRRGKRFLERIFDRGELGSRGFVRKEIMHLAGRFSAKEAILKALGIGLQKGVSWHDMVIEKCKNGSLKVILFGELARFAKKKGVKRILVSLTHTERIASAVAIALGR